MPTFKPLSLCLCYALAAARSPAEEPPQAAPVSQETESLVKDWVSRHDGFGLGPDSGLAVVDSRLDPDGSRHLRLQQQYRGLPVWGGQVILHLDPAGRELPPTDALVRGIQLAVEPNLSPAEGLAIAHQQETPDGAYSRTPKAELVVYPATALERAEGAAEGRNARDFVARVTRFHLAYHIHLDLDHGAPETRHDDYLVDAHTGAVIRRWSTLFTLKGRYQSVTTRGKSQHSGEVDLHVLRTGCGYVMSDPTRQYISTRDLAGGFGDVGMLYVSQTGAWGDGQNYDASRGTKSDNGQTAAVDAHYGLQTTWDFYRQVLDRNGIDGKGRSARNLVHYGSRYDNAFWDDDCFCMKYGDGETFKTLTALDVVGHEVSHGLCHATADLEYFGESGGLNEASSDIFGVMIHLYATAAKGNGRKLPAKGGRWTIGADLLTPSNPNPIRYLYKPSLDGFSPDAWSPDLENLEVHFSSGPMNRAFYFLSQGASAKSSESTYSSYLPRGMRGIGNDKAVRIWWRALSTYLTPRSRYQDARRGSLRAAADLYGRGSAEVRAVRLAFHGINVDDRNALAPAPEVFWSADDWDWDQE